MRVVVVVRVFFVVVVVCVCVFFFGVALLILSPPPFFLLFFLYSTYIYIARADNINISICNIIYLQPPREYEYLIFSLYNKPNLVLLAAGDIIIIDIYIIYWKSLSCISSSCEMPFLLVVIWWSLSVYSILYNIILYTSICCIVFI